MGRERVNYCPNGYSVGFISVQFLYQIPLFFLQFHCYKVCLLSRAISECQLKIALLFRNVNIVVPIYFIFFCFSCDCLKLGDASGDSLSALPESSSHPASLPPSLHPFYFLFLSFPHPSLSHFMLCSRFWLCANCAAIEVERNAATPTATLAAAQHSYAPLLLMKANDNYAHTHTRGRTGGSGLLEKRT